MTSESTDAQGAHDALFTTRRRPAPESRDGCLGRGHGPSSIRSDVLGRSATTPRGGYQTAATMPATAHVRGCVAIGWSHRLHISLQFLDLSATTHKPHARGCYRCRDTRNERSRWLSVAMQKDLTQELLRQSASGVARLPHQIISRPLCFCAAWACLLPVELNEGHCHRWRVGTLVLNRPDHSRLDHENYLLHYLCQPIKWRTRYIGM